MTIGAFGFDHYQRDAVDETHNVWAARLNTASAGNAKLFGKAEMVVGGVAPINQGNGRVGFFAINKFGDGNAVQ